MRMGVIMVFLACMGLCNAWAGLKTKVLEYEQGDTVLEGYLAYDDSFRGKRPGVLVVHEWMGLDDYAKMRTDMLARLGYVAFAADIYGKGVRPKTVQEAAAEAAKFKSDRLLLRKRSIAALDILRCQPNVDSSRVAAIGYCFGGTTVLELVRSGAEIKGVVSFHGGLSAGSAKTAANAKAKILVLHGADDPFVPPAEVAAFEKEMKDAHIQYQLIKYPKAVHGFTNPANTGQIKGALYNKEADTKSWREMRKFLKSILSR